MDYDNAKRLKSSSGSPVSVKRTAATALPQYQPPPARGSPSNQTPSATLSRTPPPGGKNSLKLTVKAAPSKLRQAISGSQLPPNPYTNEASESDATPKPSARTARATRNPRTVVEQDSDDDDDDDDDDDEDAEGEDDDEDAEGEDVDRELLANEDSQDDAEGEDEDMDDIPDTHPQPPVIKQQKLPGKSKANVTVSAPAAGPLKSVEAKELEDADDDELSDLESGDEIELGDGEGDEEEDIGEEDDDLSGSDIDGSRSATPDPTKLTRRQRGVFEEESVGLLALSNEAQKKKLLSVEEHAMRRQEMARRRKNLSEKRNEEEKMETINKLLSKPAPKRRTRAEMIAAERAADLTPGAEDDEGRPRANPHFSRWVNNKNGSRVAVPDEWLEGPIGDVFKLAKTASNGGTMVQEVA